MVGAYEKVSGKKVLYRVVCRRVGDFAECYANPQKADDLLKWTAKRILDDMCSSTWQFQQLVEA